METKITTEELKQKKLSPAEWTYIEMPLSAEQVEVLNMIAQGFNNLEIRVNENKSLFDFSKIENNPSNAFSIYETFFAPRIAIIDPNYKLKVDKKKPKPPNSKDKIRINNTAETIKKSETSIFEFALLNYCDKILKKEQIELNCFVLSKLLTNTIPNVNSYVRDFAKSLIDKQQIDEKKALEVFPDIVFNRDLHKYADRTLYQHQKQIFKLFTKNKEEDPPLSKLIFYTAPTGTGKTLSPIGLLNARRVIFVCAARHVGLSLARSAINIGKKVGFAFGCETADEIRLHNAAAAEILFRDKRSGAIKKINHARGEKVELMISDLQSYPVAMRYMLAFNNKEDLMLYWDEPTISLDYEEHELHNIIHNNWVVNVIPEIVLSSATLPSIASVPGMVADMQSRFGETHIHTITSFDFDRSISLIDQTGCMVSPHNMFDKYSDLLKCVEHIKRNKTLLRYINLRDAVDFLLSITDIQTLPFNSLSVTNVKMLYLDALENADPDFFYTLKTNRETLKTNRDTEDISLRISTLHAHTVKEGPGIYMTDEALQVVREIVEQLNIPESTLHMLEHCLEHNEAISEQISEVQRNLEDKTKGDCNNAEKAFKAERELDSGEFKGNRQLYDKLAQLRSQLQVARMPETFVPNKPLHVKRWLFNNDLSLLSPLGGSLPKTFTSDVRENEVKAVMELEIDTIYKILILIGIGVFNVQTTPEYLELVKTLAMEQRLFLIVASSDYIYGTNYQFGHGFLHSDLNLTQQKTIQALGRVGRQSGGLDYTVRVLDNKSIRALFLPGEDQLEAANMQRLLCRD